MNEKINITDLTLVTGIGDYSAHTACLVSAAVAKWRMEHGEELGKATDSIECIDSPIRRIAISINDGKWWNSNNERTETLLPFIDQILGTKGSSELTQRRAYKCADYAIRVFLPMALDLKNPEQAEHIRSLPEIVDVNTAIVGKKAADAAGAEYTAAAAASTGLYAARSAAGAAAAAEDAAAAATAADDTARAAAYADYSAAADAAKDAADYSAAAADATAAAVSTGLYAARAAGAAAAAADAADRAAYHASHAAKIPTRTAALRLLTEMCLMTD